jgi:hypothetical protein
VGSILLPGSALGQDDAAKADRSRQVPEDFMSKPTPDGFRLTPELARPLAGMFVKGALLKDLELDEAKQEEATEMVTRRLMQMAHNMGDDIQIVQAFAEAQAEQMLKTGAVRVFIPQGFGPEFGERMLRIIPHVRAMAKGVVQDVRPMLPMKKQLKLAAEMVAFNTGMDAFEERMQQWSEGDIENPDNPFSDRAEQEVELNEEGISQDLENARNRAEQISKLENRTRQWEGYVKNAVAYYGFDAQQEAMAESILREQTALLQNLMSDPSRSDAVYRTRLWKQIMWRYPSYWHTPFREMLEDKEQLLTSPIERLEEQLKSKIARIPTRTQRQQAESKIDKLLSMVGYSTTQPAGGDQ